jgi:hypothetical protein
LRYQKAAAGHRPVRVVMGFPQFSRHRVNVFQSLPASHKWSDSCSQVSSVGAADCRSTRCNRRCRIELHHACGNVFRGSARSLSSRRSSPLLSYPRCSRFDSCCIGLRCRRVAAGRARWRTAGIQLVVATRFRFSEFSSSLSASAGVRHPRVFLGRVFSVMATACRSVGYRKFAPESCHSQTAVRLRDVMFASSRT